VKFAHLNPIFLDLVELPLPIENLIFAPLFIFLFKDAEQE